MINTSHSCGCHINCIQYTSLLQISNVSIYVLSSNLLQTIKHNLFDIVYIEVFKVPIPSFDIKNFISFSTNRTRSNTYGKLTHKMSSNNIERNFFFFRIPRPWNTLPPIDLSLSLATNKIKITEFLQSHFMSHFKSNNPCTYQLVCPFSKCTQNHPSPNFNS